MNTVDDASVRLHLGQIHLGLVAVEVELGLDAKHDPAAVDQLLDLGSPAVVDVAAGVFADVGVVDVLVHQDCWLEAWLCRFGVAKGIADHFLCVGHLDISSVARKGGERISV